jgi:hypothetical protein
MLNLRVKLTYNFALSYIILPTINQYLIYKEMNTEDNEINKKLII